MQHKNNLLFLMAIICVTIITSCKFYTFHKYHLGNKFHYKDKVSLLNHLVDNVVFEKDKILYLDSSHYFDFIVNKVQHDSSLFYLGCYLNDSTVVKMSDLLNGNTSCSGRIKNEIEDNFSIKIFDQNNMLATTKLSRFQLKRLSSNEIINIDDSDKKIKIFFTYSYKFGTYYDSFFKEIKLLNTKYKTADLYLVCIDILE